jgi:hypothetical protein
MNFTDPSQATMPMIALIVVERPTPLRPSSDTISPLPMPNCTPCRMWLLP